MRGRKYVNVVERFASCIVSQLQRSCCLGVSITEKPAWL